MLGLYSQIFKIWEMLEIIRDSLWVSDFKITQVYWNNCKIQVNAISIVGVYFMIDGKKCIQAYFPA